MGHPVSPPCIELNTSRGFGSTLTSLIDGVFGNIGNIFSCVLWVKQQQ